MRVKGTHLKVPRRHSSTHLETGSAFVPGHTGGKSSSGTGSKADTDAVPVPDSAQDKQQRQFCFCPFPCSPQAAPEMKPLLRCLFQCTGPAWPSLHVLHTDCTQKLFLSSSRVSLICSLRVLDSLAPPSEQALVFSLPVWAEKQQINLENWDQFKALKDATKGKGKVPQITKKIPPRASTYVFYTNLTHICSSERLNILPKCVFAKKSLQNKQKEWTPYYPKSKRVIPCS